MAWSNLTKREILVGMISGAVLYPFGLYLIQYHIESKVVCYTLGILVCFMLQFISFHTVYGYEFKKKQCEFEKMLADDFEKSKRIIAEADRRLNEAERKFDEGSIYKD